MSPLFDPYVIMHLSTIVLTPRVSYEFQPKSWRRMYAYRSFDLLIRPFIFVLKYMTMTILTLAIEKYQ